MRIDRLDIPEGYKGLKKSSLMNLSDIVLLAGPNGGGKSRVLNAVLDNCNRMTPAPPGHQRRQLSSYRAELAEAEATLRSVESSDSFMAANWRTDVEQKRRAVDNLEQALVLVPVIEPDPQTPPLVVDLTTGNVTFQDAISASTWSTAQAEIGRQLDLGSATKHGPGAVYALLTNAIAATSSMSVMTDFDRSEYVRRLGVLNKLTEQIIGSSFTIGRMEEGAVLFGHPLGNGALLSSGQRLLLAVTYLLFFQESTDKDVILVWDEPENHLHPSAVLHILDSLRAACPKAQMWIATHSVHILAHYQEHGIWFAREGAVTRGGKVAEQVLGSLLGDESQLYKLSEFLAQPAQRVLNQFAGQCLVPPGTVDTLPGDPQTDQIYRVLADNSGGAVKVLDFGAGKGRLLSELASHVGALERIDYFAYDLDPSSSDKEAIGKYLSASYEEAGVRYLFGKADEVLKPWFNEFNAVILCNALHEIPLDDWGVLFGPEGIIVKLLKEDGHLLVVEDYVLAAGERAHRFGFLLLDAKELHYLFAADEGEIASICHQKEEYRDRLKVHAVPRKALMRMNDGTLLRSLSSLRDRSYQEARERHSASSGTAKAGHALAVAAHQHLNALLAIESLQHQAMEGNEKGVEKKIVEMS